MRRACLALSAVLAVSGPVPAQPTDSAAPRFTLSEEVIIARNDALNELFKSDPRSVRKIIDAMAAAKQQPPSRQRDVGERRTGEGTVEIDPLRNPDLEVFQRSSPEAAYDLFQLLKRVGGKK